MSVARIRVLNGRQHFGNPPPDAAEAHDADRAVVQVARRPANELAWLAGPERTRAGCAVSPVTRASACSATWSASTPEALVTIMSDATTDGHQAMVEPGGRRLNPLQPAAAHDRVPVDRHLGMAAEDVGPQNLLGDPLLPGVDQFGLREPRRRSGRNVRVSTG